MRIRFTERVRLTCTFAALALLAGAMFAQAASAKTLRIAWTAVPSNIPVKVAEEQGFYKKYGIDAKLTANSGGGAQLPSLGRQWDVLVSQVADFLLFEGKHGDAVVLATGQVDTKATAQPNLIVKKGVNSLKQLKGKTICSISVGQGQQYISLAIALSKAGMDPKKDVKIALTPFPNMLDAMRADKCDAALAIQPYINQMKATGDYAGLNNTLLSVSKVATGTMYTTSRKLAKKDPKSFRAFQKAYTDAVNLCKKTPDVCIDSIVKNLGTNRNAARSTPFNAITPKTKNKWITDWIKPMERYGFLKKGRVSTKKNYVFK